MRRNITLTKHHDDKLLALCTKLGKITRSEALRRAIDALGREVRKEGEGE